MRQLRQLSQFIEVMPLWGIIAIAAFLVAYTASSIYGRFNTRFGVKIFSKIPASEIQSNVSHIIQYTVIPTIVTVGFFVMLLAR